MPHPKQGWGMVKYKRKWIQDGESMQHCARDHHGVIAIYATAFHKTNTRCIV